MYLIRTPNFIQSIFPNFVWKVPSAEKVLYLTFDDGPIPEVTPWVLDQLAEFDAKATFFCVGENAERHSDIMDRIHGEGHVTANHTHNHLSGWRSENLTYFHNIRRCASQVNSNLFRPPYGRLKPSQAQFLLRHYTVVMWDVLSADFDASVTPEQCLANVTENAQPGSIIVLHDSLKAENNLRYALPKILAYYSGLGYRFSALEDKVNVRTNKLRKTA